jgi:predicted dehydrogenase
MLGAGAMGSRWIRDVWQPFRSRMEFVGLVDPNPAALREASDWLGLPPAARFTDAGEAFATVDADFCCIVTPPAHHREAVELACGRRMDILSEKPIADTLEACAAIARAVKAAGVRMMVTQNYRYTRRILTLKEALTELGSVNYAVARYASDYRERGAWGMFRHEMRHGLLIEGGVHHLDQLRNLCGADCQSIAGWDWNPGHVRSETVAWRSSDAFDGEACALLVMRMTNASFASYEGNSLETGKTNSWYGEYYRIECEGAHRRAECGGDAADARSASARRRLGGPPGGRGAVPGLARWRVATGDHRRRQPAVDRDGLCRHSRLGNGHDSRCPANGAGTGRIVTGQQPSHRYDLISRRSQCSGRTTTLRAA